MAAAEHERAGPVDRGQEGQRPLAAGHQGQRKQREERGEEDEPHPARDRRRLRAVAGFYGAVLAAQDEPERAARGDGRNLARSGRREGHQDQGEDRDRRTRLVGRKVLHHAEHGLRDDGDGDELQAMQQAIARRAFERARAETHERHGDRRGQREPGPRREAAKITGAHEADRKPCLAARRAGQELAERNEIGVSALVEPAALDDERVAEIAEMRDRPTEASQAEFQEDAENLEGRAGAA